MRRRRQRRVGLAVALLLLGISQHADAATVPSARAARANAPAPTLPRSQGAPRAPSSPPLTNPSLGEAGVDESPAAGSEGELDPLVSNGLGSPGCERASGRELSATGRSHCETSGFVASAAPTVDYGIDVHIDKGVLGLSDGGLMSAVQDLFVTPLWMALVWAVHALVVMLEWCFSLDLLAGATAGHLGSGLRQMEGALTTPWLPLALAVAAILAAYHGLVRRRVAETIGQVALMAAMMVGGLWVILDPSGTLGALGQWADQAAIGTLATAAQGSPRRPERALGAGLEAVFAAAIQAPWCYLEFGDVRWCREPARLDPRLHRAALRIATLEQSLVGCKLSPLADCATAGNASARVLQHSARLLREAPSNGAIFLALPANGAARNSINDGGSLLRTICASSHATDCNGPSAAQAQFRTNNSTWSRVGGLMLIAAGLLGLLLLLGFLALRLLTAAIFGLLYLLLAPAMILAPAFGDGGRMLFRRWSAQLLGTVVAKLIYSFLLGVVMAVLALVASLSMVGWWTQWLLMSALWWGAFARRHQALGVFGGEIGKDASGRPAPRHRAVREVSKLIARRRREKRKEGQEAPPVKPRPHTDADRPPMTSSAGDAPRRAPEKRGSGAEGSTPLSAPDAGTAEKRSQIQRILSSEETARGEGHERQTSELPVGGERVHGESEGPTASAHGQGEPEAHGHPPREPGAPVTGASDARGRAQARPSPGSSTSLGDGEGKRDYAALATSWGSGVRPICDSIPRLVARHGWRSIKRWHDAKSRGRSSQARPQHDSAPRREDGQPPKEDSVDSGADAGAAAPVRARKSESIVMRDAREVQAGRKRQLGRGRP